MARSLVLLVLAAMIPFAAGALDAADRAPTGISTPTRLTAADWPWWRGPNRDGIAAPDQHPPLNWSETENVVWKAPIPGRGHGSPTIVGDQVFLATADEMREVQSVLCFDRRTGKQLWKTDVHTGGMTPNENKESSQASCTVACDGERLFVNFQHDGAIFATALGRDGNQLWQKKIGGFVSHQGYGASPAVYKSLVIFSADNKGGGTIAALDRASGDTVWSLERPKLPNYTSPVILTIDGHDQLLFTGCDLVSSFDPLTGKKLWETAGATTECVTSTVTDGRLIFTSGGYPKNHVSAVRADGSGQVAWENTSRVYVPSMLLRDGILYAVSDPGLAMCWHSDTGKEIWKSRLAGTFTASPVLAGDHIFAANRKGQTFVFKASPKAFELVAENRLGDEVFATPAICDSHIFMRVVSGKDDGRQEMLYCLGK